MVGVRGDGELGISERWSVLEIDELDYRQSNPDLRKKKKKRDKAAD
jgi:hypothetical protein